MGILGRIQRIIKGSVDGLSEKIGDPAKEVELLIVEMREGLRQARAEIVTAMAEAKRHDRGIEQLEADSRRWRERAVQAVGGGDDDLAREAIGERVRCERRRQEAEKARDKQWAYVEQLKQSLEQLENRLREVEGSKESIKQRARAAKEGESPLSGGRAFRQLDRLEARIEAMEELGGITRSASERDAEVEAKFARLEGSSEVEDELAELKRRVSEGSEE